MGTINTGGIIGGASPTPSGTLGPDALATVAPLLNLDTMGPAAAVSSSTSVSAPGVNIPLNPANMSIIEFYGIVNTAIQVLNETLSSIQVSQSLLDQKFWVASYENAIGLTQLYTSYANEAYQEQALYNSAKAQLSAFQTQVNSLVSAYNQTLNSAQPQLQNVYQNMLIYNTVYPPNSTFVSGAQPAFDNAQLTFTSALTAFNQAQQVYTSQTTAYNSAQLNFMSQEQSYLQAASAYNLAAGIVNTYSSALSLYQPGSSDYNLIVSQMAGAEQNLAQATTVFQSAQSSFQAAQAAFQQTQNSYSLEKNTFDTAVSKYLSQLSKYTNAQNAFNQVFNEVSQLNAEYAQAQQKFASSQSQFNTALADLNAAQASYNSANSTFSQEISSYQAAIAAATPGTSSYNTIVQNFFNEEVNFRNNTLSYQSTLFKYSVATVTYNSAVAQYTQTVKGFISGQQAINRSVDIYAQAAPPYETAVHAFQTAQSAFNASQLIYNSAYAQWGVSQLRYNSAAASFASAAAAFNSDATTFQNQQNAYNAAEVQYNNALQLFQSQESYYNYVAANYSANSPTYINELAAFKQQESVFNAAVQTYDSAQNTYNSGQQAYAADQVAYQSAVKSYDQAQQVYNTAVQTYDNAVSVYQTAVAAYNQAETAYAAATMKFISSGPVDPQTVTDYNNAVAAFQSAEASFNQAVSTFQAAQQTYQTQENAFVAAQSSYAAQEQAYIQQQSLYTSQAAVFSSDVGTYNAQINGSSPGDAQYLAAINTYIPQQASYNAEVQNTYDPAQQTYAQNVAAFDASEQTFNAEASTFDTATVTFNSATLAMNQAQSTFEQAINVLERNNYNRITTKYDQYAQALDSTTIQGYQAQYQSAVNTYLSEIAADNAKIAQLNKQRSALPFGSALPKISTFTSEVPPNLTFNPLPDNVPTLTSASPHPDLAAFIDSVPLQQPKMNIPITPDPNNPQALTPAWAPSALSKDIAGLLNSVPIYSSAQGSIFQANDTSSSTDLKSTQPEKSQPTFLDAFSLELSSLLFVNKLLAAADAYNQAQASYTGVPVSPSFQNAYIHPFPEAYTTTGLSSGPVAGVAEPSLALGLDNPTLDSLIGADILQIARTGAFLPKLVKNELLVATLSVLSHTGLYAAMPTLRAFSNTPEIIRAGLSPVLRAGLALSFADMVNKIVSGNEISAGIDQILGSAGMSSAQIAQNGGTVAAALKIAMLEFAVFQLAGAVGMPGLTGQVVGGAFGLKNFAAIGAAGGRVNVNSVLNNPFLAAFLAQSLSESLAQLQGAPVSSVAGQVSSALANVLQKQPFMTESEFIRALSSGLKSAGYTAEAATLLANDAAAFIAAEQEVAILDAQYNREQVQQAVLTNNIFLEPSIRQAVAAAQSEGTYQTNRQFRDAVVKQLIGQGQSKQEAMANATQVMQAIQGSEFAVSSLSEEMLVSSLASALVQRGVNPSTAAQAAAAAAAATLQGTYSSERAFRGALATSLEAANISPAEAAAASESAAVAFYGRNPLLSAGSAEMLSQAQLAQALTEELVGLFKPQLGAAGAFTLAQQITAAVVGPETNSQAWQEQNNYPASLYNQIQSEVKFLEAKHANHLVTQSLEKQFKAFIKPSVSLYDFTLRVMDPANTFLISMGWGLMYQGMGTQPTNYIKSVDILI